MLEVFERRCRAEGVEKVELRLDSVETDLPNDHFDLIIHSSFLHAVCCPHVACGGKGSFASADTGRRILFSQRRG